MCRTTQRTAPRSSETSTRGRKLNKQWHTTSNARKNREQTAPWLQRFPQFYAWNAPCILLTLPTVNIENYDFLTSDTKDKILELHPLEMRVTSQLPVRFILESSYRDSGQWKRDRKKWNIRRGQLHKKWMWKNRETKSYGYGKRVILALHNFLISINFR